MKIPSESSNRGLDRLSFFDDVVRACFHSQTQRIEQYDILRHYWLYGVSPDGEVTPYNKCEPTIDTLTSFLYGADSTRFSAQFGPHIPLQERDKAKPIAQAVNDEWTNSGADQIFGQGLDLACVYNSTFIKTVVKAKRTVPYVVDPHCIGVYREDINGLDRQEAIAHRYYISRSQLESELARHPNKAEIIKAVPARPIQAKDDMPEGLRRIIVSNMAGVPPITPNSTLSGNAHLMFTERMNYSPSIAADVVEMTELWVRDDAANGDWLTVTMAEGPVVIYDRPNIFVPLEQPFTQICPMPLHGYFWGLSYIGKLIGLQCWRNKRVDEIQRLLALQALPPTSLTGWDGPVDEMNFALNQPGGVLAGNSPMSKVERHDPTVPNDLWLDLGHIDEMFMEAAALPPLLMGRGETGVRSGRQTTELSRLGGSRIKKRALVIEANLEILATKTFRAMQKYDDSVYKTEPESGPPMKFVLEQAPKDTVIKVDAHSNSPLFLEDQREDSLVMLENHVIDRASYIELTNPPMKDVLLHKLPGIEAKEQAAAAAAMKHEEALVKLRRPDPLLGAGTMGGSGGGAAPAPAKPNGATKQ